jgi:hypothetical protein
MAVRADRTKRGGSDAEQRRRTARFKKVFGTPDGRRVLDDLLDHLGVNGRLFATDSRIQEHNVARNDFGVWILEQINWKPKMKSKEGGETDE